ncbi:STAS domain-containing protein [Mycolicibacterium sp. 120270]|uniref:STAS domain-containing protein n=1 Tax=Mycolicibacterium sp. 120270 TaxID=3090600 RepID=UPI00299D0294|nr:STAS domain-containing protein [Mycolicibacterium sp. 120270]MDX1883857.1 STAS domain-containing protein [Mycolicibacterium sp. 120270]
MQEKDTYANHFTLTHIEVRRAVVDSSVIHIRGGLLNAAAESVWQALETEFRRLPELVALDVSDVTDIDDVGVGVLVAAAGRAGESDISFCLVGAREGAVGTALAEAHVTELFEIVPEVAAP